MAIGYDIDGAIVVITIDRPEVMNCLDPEHNQMLTEAFARFEADDALRCAVLTGGGDKAFSAGADLKKLIPSFRDQVRAGESPAWELGGITWTGVGKPRIAAVNGYALAGGTELALACDIRIASTTASFGLAETKWAIIPGAGGTQRLPRAVGLGQALQIILTGDPVDAQTALQWGLVNQVVAQDELLPTAIAMAKTIASRGPLAVKAAKAAVYAGLDMSLTDGLQMEREVFLGIMRTEDAVEGSTAFTEKRNPVYRGI
jgi:enoyl-CoA hydratase/carnithine racemase